MCQGGMYARMFWKGVLQQQRQQQKTLRKNVPGEKTIYDITVRIDVERVLAYLEEEKKRMRKEKYNK